MPWTRTGTWTGTRERAWARAVAITRTGKRCIVVAVTQPWAGNWALAGTVFLIAVPGP